MKIAFYLATALVVGIVVFARSRPTEPNAPPETVVDSIRPDAPMPEFVLPPAGDQDTIYMVGMKYSKTGTLFVLPANIEDPIIREAAFRFLEANAGRFQTGAGDFDLPPKTRPRMTFGGKEIPLHEATAAEKKELDAARQYLAPPNTPADHCLLVPHQVLPETKTTATVPEHSVLVKSKATCNFSRCQHRRFSIGRFGF